MGAQKREPACVCMFYSRLILSNEVSYATLTAGFSKEQKRSGNSSKAVNQFFVIIYSYFVVINVHRCTSYNS